MPCGVRAEQSTRHRRSNAQHLMLRVDIIGNPVRSSSPRESDSTASARNSGQSANVTAAGPSLAHPSIAGTS